MADNCWVCKVEMHARRGAEITWIYPEEDASATRRAVFEAELPFACLGEACRAARDVRDAAATRFVDRRAAVLRLLCVADGLRRDAERAHGSGQWPSSRRRRLRPAGGEVLALASLPPDDDDTRAALRAAQARGGRAESR